MNGAESEVYISVKHPEDFDNLQHNIKNININNYIKRPEIYNYSVGPIFYISNKSSNILISHLEKINYNVFELDEYTNSYPYTLEDVGVAFILYSNNINFINNSTIFGYNDTFYNRENCIAIHTNYLNE